MWTKIYVMSLVYVRQTWKPAPCLHFRQDMGRLCQSFALALWNHRFEMEKNESEAIGALLLLFLNDTASHPSLRWLFTPSSSEVVHNNRFHSWTRLERPQPRSNNNESKVCPFLKYDTSQHSLLAWSQIIGHVIGWYLSFARLLSFLSVMMHCTLIVRKRDGEQLRVRQWNYWFVGSEVWTVLQQSWHGCKMTFEICRHYKNVLWSVGNTLGTIDVEWRRRTVLTGVWRAFVFELSICINTCGSIM